METNIDQIPAGRELDALVAEKVMGWEVVRLGDGGEDRDTTFPCLLLPNDDSDYLKLLSPISSRVRWSPSTDIAAAWEVVEKLKLSLIPVTAGWIVSPHHLFEGPAGEGLTAPLAICRAALKMHELINPR